MSSHRPHLQTLEARDRITAAGSMSRASSGVVWLHKRVQFRTARHSCERNIASSDHLEIMPSYGFTKVPATNRSPSRDPADRPGGAGDNGFREPQVVIRPTAVCESEPAT